MPSLYKVWDTFSSHFYVFEQLNHETKSIERFSDKERITLLKAMIKRAKEDEKILVEICEMAAMQITDRGSYKYWVENENADA